MGVALLKPGYGQRGEYVFEMIALDVVAHQEMQQALVAGSGRGGVRACVEDGSEKGSVIAEFPIA